MLVFRLACITIVLGLSFATENSDFEIRPRVLRDCNDIYLNGDQVEGYYAVVPYDNKLGEAALIYCGVNDGMIPLNSSVPKTSPQNCQDLKDGGMANSGLNVIYPYIAHPETPVIVYCDQEYRGGGWTVIQRRDDFDTQLDFYRSFDEYSLGFGNPGGELWLGLDIIHELTQQSVNELNIDLTSFGNVNKYAHYNTFYVGPKVPTAVDMSIEPYFMSASQYSGNAGDSLTYHLGMAFSTHDADHDGYSGNCAESFHGGWWYSYRGCHNSNLNGRYYDDGSISSSSVCWYTFNNDWQSLRRVVMSVRPIKQQ